MSTPTFFPREVRVALEAVEANDEGTHFSDVNRLVDELRRWERKWRAGEIRLVPQIEPKPNGEGGL